MKKGGGKPGELHEESISIKKKKQFYSKRETARAMPLSGNRACELGFLTTSTFGAE